MQFLVYSLLCSPAAAVPPATCDIQQVNECVQSVQREIDQFNDDFHICNLVLKESASCFAACDQEMMSDFIKKYDNGRCANFNPYAAKHNRLNHRAARKGRDSSSSALPSDSLSSKGGEPRTLVPANQSASTSYSSVTDTANTKSAVSTSPGVGNADTFLYVTARNATAAQFSAAASVLSASSTFSISAQPSNDNLESSFVQVYEPATAFTSMSSAGTQGQEEVMLQETLPTGLNPGVSTIAESKPTATVSSKTSEIGYDHVTGLSPAIHAINPLPANASLNAITYTVPVDEFNIAGSKPTTGESTASVVEALGNKPQFTIQTAPNFSPDVEAVAAAQTDFSLTTSAEIVSGTQASAPTSGVYTQDPVFLIPDPNTPDDRFAKPFPARVKNMNQSLEATTTSSLQNVSVPASAMINAGITMPVAPIWLSVSVIIVCILAS